MGGGGERVYLHPCLVYEEGGEHAGEALIGYKNGGEHAGEALIGYLEGLFGMLSDGLVCR